MKVLLASNARLDPALLASHLAGRFGRQAVEVDVLTVVPGIDAPADDAATGHGRIIGITEGPRDFHQACAHVATLAMQLQAQGLHKVRTHVEYGDPAEVILAASRRWHSQLLLIGAPRRGGLLTAFRLDGVTRRLLRWADCPLELMRPDAGQSDLRRCVLPLAAAALLHVPLQTLQKLPWQDGDQLHLLCALPPGLDESRMEASPAAALLALQQGRDAAARARSRLAALQESLQESLPARVQLSHELGEGSLSALTVRHARARQPGLVLLHAACLTERQPEPDPQPPTALALSLPGSVLLLQDENLSTLPQRGATQARLLKFAR